jgi:hypothetical protein
VASAYFLGLEEWMDINLTDRDKEWLAEDPERKLVVYIWEATVRCIYFSARGIRVEWEETGRVYTFMPDPYLALEEMRYQFWELCEQELEITNLYLQDVELVNPYAG